VLARATTAQAGDFRVDGDPGALRGLRQGLHPAPWTWLRQDHGAGVVTVGRPGEGAGQRADAAVTVTPGCPLSVTTADCAPLVLVAEAGVGVVHVGWRGAQAGVVEAAAAALRSAGGGAPVAAWLGACIGPAAYRFGGDDLARLVERYGPSVLARHSSGDPALDLRAAVRAACTGAGWPPPAEPACTSDPRFYSHRVRGDRARQVTVAWLEPDR
jgi:copper oxidase (laccase) domain-containing protein